MPPKAKPCRQCGSRAASKGGLCAACAAAPARKAAAGPVCPHCKAEVTWDSMGTSETEVTIYVREKMYFCSRCRALLGFSSWHTEG